MRTPRSAFVLAFALSTAACFGLGCARTQSPPGTSSVAPSPDVQAAGGSGPNAAAPQPAAGTPRAPGVAMKDQSVGEPKGFDNLTVFPIFAKNQTDVGPLT